MFECCAQYFESMKFNKYFLESIRAYNLWILKKGYKTDDTNHTVAYLGGPLGHRPCGQKNFVGYRKKLENIIWPPFV